MTEPMARAAARMTRTYLESLRAYHRSVPNPSDESYRALLEIREIQKVLDHLEGLIAEKGWTD